MKNITIETWLDSGANSQSAYKNEFEIDKAEWDAMTEDEKDEYAKDVAWDRMDWGWRVKGASK